MNQTKDLEVILYEQLLSKHQKVSVAESCTGGLLAATIINVPGASSIIDEAIVTYANEAKMRRLNVLQSTLDRFGAVSEECVKEMAENLHKLTLADLTISISGIAGPTGGTMDKPVGTVWFGFYYLNQFYSYLNHFDGDRTTVRLSATRFALEKAIDILTISH
jgi:PncC family amidohydrolase